MTNAHFRQRVSERMPPGIDADMLSEIIVTCIKESSPYLDRICSDLSENGMRKTICRFQLLDQSWYAVVNDSDLMPVTMLTQEKKRDKKRNRKRVIRKYGAGKADFMLNDFLIHIYLL